MPGFLKKTIQISLTLVVLFSITGVIFAQGSVSNSLSTLNLSISPSSPRAGDSVVLTLSSNLIDLNSSKIVWYIDGVAIKNTASKSITIKAKSDGQSTTVRVVAETSDGIAEETSTEISPGGVDLVVEPMSYTLPFYKGKPFFASQGTVKVVAVPDVMINGVETPPTDLTFKWSENDYVLGANSGKGNDSIIVNSTIPVRDINIGLQILDDSGNVLAENSKLITINNPEILFYENNPLYGILYNKAITGNYYLGTGKELDVVAKPFSFAFVNDTPDESSYTWSLNGNYIAPNGKANEIILKQTATGLAGTASVSLDLSNSNKIDQYATGGFNIQFGQ